MTLLVDESLSDALPQPQNGLPHATYTLLPPNSTPLEYSLEAIMEQRLEAINVPIREVWDPEYCPVFLLPWLAWAYGVNTWDSTWSESQQRQVISNALYIHKHRGTLAAVERALASTGYNISIVEWFADQPKQPAYTFRIDIDATNGIAETNFSNMIDVINAAKNVRSHLARITTTSKRYGAIYSAGALAIGDVIHLYTQGAPTTFTMASLFTGSTVERTGGYYSVKNGLVYQGNTVSTGPVDALTNLAAPNAVGTTAIKYLPENTDPAILQPFYYQAVQSFNIADNQPTTTPITLPSIGLFGFYQHDVNPTLDAATLNSQLQAITLLARGYIFNTTDGNTVVLPTTVEYVIDYTVSPPYISAKQDGIEVNNTSGQTIQPSDLLNSLNSQDGDNNPETYLLYFGLCQFSTDYLVIGRRLSDSEIAQAWGLINA